jgi:hypothetical protein
VRTSGHLTWLVWAFVHILSLSQSQNRLRVQRQWLWSYFTGQRSSRLIPEPPQTPGAERRQTSCDAAAHHERPVRRRNIVAMSRLCRPWGILPALHTNGEG